MKRVLFDDVFFNIASSGIARVWRSCFREPIFKETLLAKGIELIILDRSGELCDLGFETIPFPKYRGDSAELDRLQINAVIESRKFDLFISSYYTFTTSCPNFVVVYDLIAEKFNFERANKTWVERLLAIHSDSHFFTISKNSARDLVECYPWIDPDNISWSYPGVDLGIFTPSHHLKIREFRLANGLSSYFVWLGGRDAPYKNSKLLLDTIAQFPFDSDFVFVGGSPLTTEEVDAAAQMGNRILHLALDDEELSLCLQGSKCLIYPSLYEGFGLPPLEALALGVPVITTSKGSLLEAVGDLSEIISGKSTSELASKVALIEAGGLGQEAKSEGAKWAARFKWSTFASDFAGAIERRLRLAESLFEPERKILEAYTLEQLQR